MSTDLSTLPAVRVGNAIELRSIDADTPLAIHSSGRDYLVTPKDILEWVAPTAPLGEAKKFLVICQATGLNPLIGDIDLLPFSGKFQAVVRKNGYLKAARRDPDYDGHESGISVQAYQVGPDKRKVKTGSIIDVPGTVVPDGHLLVGGWCRMYRKGISRPVYKRVAFSEYGKNTPGPWQSIPCTMIEKVAIAHAARESIDLLAGTYDESEMYQAGPVPTRLTVDSHGYAVPIPRDAPQQVPAPAPSLPSVPIEAEVIEAVAGPINTVADPVNPDPDAIRPDQIEEIERLVPQVGMTGSQYADMLTRRGVSDIRDLDCAQGDSILSKLRGLADLDAWNPLGGKAEPENPESPETQENQEQTA